jgi:adenine-specific DNA-methyltransferase
MSERFGLQFVGRAALDRAPAAAHGASLRGDGSRARSVAPGRDAIVVGDNLVALELLRATHAGKVQAIYIDPPYNTGNEFVYRDDHGRPARRDRKVPAERHSAWLAMMLPRLRAARELLRDDGVLFVSIDDNEVAPLRLLLDEVLGPDRFIAQVIVVSNRGGRDYLPIAVTHEYLLVYGKSDAAVIREVPRPDGALPLTDARGPYELRELRNRNPRFGPHNRPNLFFALHVDPRRADAHGCCAVSLRRSRAHAIAVEPRNKKGEPSVWRWGRPRVAAAIVERDPAASEVVARRRRDGGWNVYEKHRKHTTKPRSIWDDVKMRSEQGTIDMRARLGELVFEHAKPVELVRRCIEIGTDEDGIVLDFFAGSGTTAEAVIEQNRRDGGRRRFVLVQVDEPTPPRSLARKAGFATVADIVRARVAATCAAAGVALPACFRVVAAPARRRRR